MDKKIEEQLNQLPFEQALKQLEGIVEKMESGNLSLDEMINNFETGSALSKICNHKLTSLQKKIEVLMREDNQGGQWQEFDASSQRQNQMTIGNEQQTPGADQNSSELGDSLPF